MNGDEEFAMFYATATARRFDQLRSRGMSEWVSVTLAAWSAAEFMCSISNEGDDDANAFELMERWLETEEQDIQFEAGSAD